MIEGRQTTDDLSVAQRREEQIVYVTENRRDAEELATMLGYNVITRKKLRSTVKRRTIVQVFVVRPDIGTRTK